MPSFGNVKESSGFEQAPVGTYPGRLIQAIDLGTQETAYGPKRKVALTFETSRQMDDGRPYTIGRWLNLSLFRTSSLREFLECWLGRELTPNERKDFGFELFFKVPCLLTVAEKPDQKGELRSRINSITPLPDGLEAPPLVNERVVFDLADPDRANFEKLSPGMQDIIRRSPEFSVSGLDAPPSPAGASSDTSSSPVDPDDSDKLSAIA